MKIQLQVFTTQHLNYFNLNKDHEKIYQRLKYTCPRITAVSVLFKSGARFLQSGCPLYHQTNSLAAYTPASPCIERKQDNSAYKILTTELTQQEMQHLNLHEKHRNCFKSLRTNLPRNAKRSVTFSSIGKHHLGRHKKRNCHTYQNYCRSKKNILYGQKSLADLVSYSIIHVTQLGQCHGGSKGHISKEGAAFIFCYSRKLIDHYLLQFMNSSVHQ